MIAPKEAGLPISYWSKVSVTIDRDACWRWAAARDSKGYGVFQTYCLTGKPGTRRAHIVHWESVHGPVSKGIMLDHTCHNRDCVNLDHLRLATNAQNGQNRRGPQKNNALGVRGVCYWPARDVYKAEAQVNGRRKTVGYFKTLAEADDAVRAYRREHMPYSMPDREVAA